MTTNEKGALATAKVELRAIERGFRLWRPAFDSRCDLIIEEDRKLTKVQIKYGDGKSYSSKGSIMVKLGYQTRTKKTYAYSADEVDALIVYLPRINKLCYFPCSIFEGKDRIYVRYNPPANGQKSGILFAKDYYW